MAAKILKTLRQPPWAAITAGPRTKAIAFLLIVIVPGGLVVPACYAVYHAIRHSLSK
jgi:hypothetical protein